MLKVKEQIQQIQEVKYQNISMTACVKNDGTVYVNIKNICDGLGIDYSSQLKRISRDDMLPQGVVKMTIPSSGGEQETNMMLITFLPFFLTGIKTSMVKPEIAKNLFDFKLKAKDVLAAAFLPQAHISHSSNQLLERKITSLQSQQENIIDCLSKQAEMLLTLEDEVEGLTKQHKQTDNLPSQILDVKLKGRPLLHSIIKPLAEKWNDGSMGYNATYRKVYIKMGVNWKYRMTRFVNQNEVMKKPNKIDLVATDNKLFSLFQETITKLLQD